MASAPNIEVLSIEQQLPEAEVVVWIPVDRIDLGERLRPVDTVWAEALGGMMVREGQHTAIDVAHVLGTDRFEVAGAGGHRLVGARLAGIAQIKAIIHSPNRDERRRREVSENIARRDLDPFERATFIAELIDLQKRRAGVDPKKEGRAASAQARWQQALKTEAQDATAMIAVAYGWSAAVGEQVGLSARTIRDDLLLFRRLPPSLIERLREERHPILGNSSQLRALAKLQAAEQEVVVDRLLGHGRTLMAVFSNARLPKTVSAALNLSQGSNSAGDPGAKRLSAFIGSFQRMSLQEKKGALAELAALLPAGFQIVTGDKA